MSIYPGDCGYCGNARWLTIETTLDGTASVRVCAECRDDYGDDLRS